MEMLTNLGADIVIPGSYLSTYNFKEIVRELPPIKLGLNCVGGDMATDMVRVMGQGSTLVTFGGMSKKPMAVPFDLLSTKQINLTGFWMTRWTESHSIAEKEAMFADICKLIREKKLTYFYELHDFDDFPFALAQSQQPFRLRKVVLNLDFPDRFAEHDARPESDYEIFEAPLR
jgi:mitochondrial enoyl-[acyl-carrier protein] reductase / trans-2-enoyl-CoA reductase